MDERRIAIERLYRDRYVVFRNTTATITGDYDHARDAVQEGFARALRSRGQFRGEGTLEAWVWRIVLRAALEIRRVPIEHSLGDMLIDARLVEPSPDPALAAAVRALPPRRRLVVFLRYFADLPYPEIAEICGIDEGTVAATLAQARASLAKTLTDSKEDVAP